MKLRGGGERNFSERPPFTLEHERLYTANRSNFFVTEDVKNWNTLPKTLVGAGSLNTFKNALDRLWSNQDLLYNNHRAVIEKKDYILLEVMNEFMISP